jgi:3-phosphoshikimate 1-carboxyvinyltransferase
MFPSMDRYRCQPVAGPLDFVTEIPGSKSITNRALVQAALADGHSLLTNALLAEDTKLMIEALRRLGIAITVDESAPTVEITGCRGQFPVTEASLFCGNAGTVMRFLTACAATGYGTFTLDGIARMRERPIGDLIDVLRALGAHAEYHGRDGYPPLTIHARHLRGGHVAIDAPASSQFVSALLLAAPYASSDVLIDVIGPIPSVPYLKITLGVMDAFGVPVIEQYDKESAKFIIPAPQRYTGRRYAIEPDASNAAYFFAAAAVAGGRVTVKNLGADSLQGDARFIDVLEKMGCSIERGRASLRVTGPKEAAALRGIDIDLNDMPDTAQTLAVIALFTDGPTTIRNVANLRIKETDRLAALAQELRKLGAEVEEQEEGLTIVPPRQPRGALIETFGDHRMAMSFAVAGLRIPGVEINDPGCCGKTFPDFFARWDRLCSMTA